ncbi:MAG: hypothetical protein NTZ38_02820, partial [Candidatus Taylorbacteria bacterium]|nr:hypothetical protein [Candidatus Taylorbacteria bacterium]
GAVTELGETAKDLEHINYVDLGPLGEAIYQSGKGKKVYLVIDEIEKGREELMTGILDEIENLTFTIGETGTVVKGDKKNLRIVITTNTEDSDKIPPSFRRRSLYHFMDYPSRADIAQIVNLNFPDIQKDLLDYAISVFYQYHENPDIQKKPSTPELLAWLRVLTKEYNGKIPENIPHKEVLLKYKEDQDLDIRKTDIESQEGVNHHDGELPHFVRRALQGAKIYHLVDNVNKPDFQEDDIVNNLYSGLQNAGVAFATPVFETVNYEPKCTKEFQLIVPGVEYLGGGYYAIPEDKVALFGKALDSQVEVLPTKQKFSLVMEKNKNFTKGKVDVAGTEYEGYMTEDGKVVIKKPLQL